MDPLSLLGRPRADIPRTTVCSKTLFPGAHGECLEEPLDGLSVHLGCGKKQWDGWLNVDAFRGLSTVDLVCSVADLPTIATGTAVRAAAIHVVEHFYRWELEPLLLEWKRILVPGGQLILECPCMDKVFQYIRKTDPTTTNLEMQMTGWAFWGDPSYRDPAMMHKWGYVVLELKKALEDAGYVEVQHEPPRYHKKSRDMRITGRKPR